MKTSYFSRIMCGMPNLKPVSMSIALLLGSMSFADPVICQLHPGVDPADIASTYDISFVEKTPHGDFFLFSAPAEQIESIEHAMNIDSRIVWSDTEEDIGIAEVDSFSKGGTLGVVGDPEAVYAQNVNLFGQLHWAPRFALFTIQVKVAVLDTGLSPMAESLWSNVISSQNQLTPGAQAYDLPDFAIPEEDPANFGAGHGTFVTGLIHTMAPNAALIIEKVANSSGQATVWSIMRGVTDAVYQDARIINISLGTTGESKALEKIFDWARSNGTITVAPIGNGASQGSLYPASFDSVICVAGVDANDHKASFSNWHHETDFSAPATGIKSTYWDGNLAIWSGTSFAAPQVTSALALAIGRGSKKSNGSLVNWLESVGVSIDAANPLYQNGLGSRIDFAAIDRIHFSSKMDSSKFGSE